MRKKKDLTTTPPKTQDLTATPTKRTTQKMRVEQELDELGVRIGKLSETLYSTKSLNNQSREMRAVMASQLEYMKEYATALIRRLTIWGLTDEEVDQLD